jgi:hypothetical protein
MTKRGKNAPHFKKEKKLSIKKNDNKDTCFLQEKLAYKGGLSKISKMARKEDNIILLVCHEYVFIEAPCNTWWTDSGSTIHIHIVNTMQGFLNIKKPASNDQWVYSKNILFSCVEAVETFRLIFKTRYVLDLDNVFFIPCFSRNLISVSKLDIVGLGFLFINSTFSIFKGGNFIGGGIKIDSLFKIDLDPNFERNKLSLHTNVGTKRNLMNENSTLLWHRRL